MPHTPGPWEVEGMKVMCNGALIAECGLRNLRTGLGGRSNAELIAAAPELLEALEKIVNWEHDPNGPFAWDLLDQARAAIAKAKGEVPA